MADGADSGTSLLGTMGLEEQCLAVAAGAAAAYPAARDVALRLAAADAKLHLWAIPSSADTHDDGRAAFSYSAAQAERISIAYRGWMAVYCQSCDACELAIASLVRHGPDVLGSFMTTFVNALEIVENIPGRADRLIGPRVLVPAPDPREIGPFAEQRPELLSVGELLLQEGRSRMDTIRVLVRRYQGLTLAQANEVVREIEGGQGER